MATRNDPPKTFLSQGKFIHPHDRQVFEAGARALRAEAVRQAARAIGRAVRGWLAHPQVAVHRHSHARVHAA